MDFDILKSGPKPDISFGVVSDPITIRKTLEQSRQDLYQGNYVQVEERLAAWISQCEAYLGTRSRGDGERESILRTQTSWLLGVALSVLGQAMQARGEGSAAESTFNQALSYLIEPSAEAAWVTGQERADFGYALAGCGRTEEALTCCRAALEAGMSSAEAYVLLASFFKRLNVAPEAEMALRKALELSPTALGYETLAQLLEGQGKSEPAAYQYGMAAVILLRQGESARAEQLTARAVGLFAGDAQLWSLRAKALFACTRPQEALQAADRALESDPNQVEALVARAKAQDALGLHEEALATCERILALHPDEPEASVLMSTVLLSQGRKQEAAGVMRKFVASLAAVPLEAQPWLANFLFLAEEYEDAMRWAERVLEVDPHNEIALRTKIAVLSRRVVNSPALYEDSLIALNALNALLELPLTDRAQVLYAKLVTLETIGRQSEALEVAEQASAGAPLSPDISKALVRLLLAADRPKDALEALNRALTIESDAGMLVEKGRLLVILGGKGDEAVQALNAALEMQPDIPQAYFIRGLAQFGLGHYEEALPDFEQYSSRESEDPEPLYWQGFTLLRLGRHEEAIAALEKYRLAKPKEAKALRELAAANFELKRLPQAQAALEALHAAEPDNIDDLLRLVEICKTAGEPDRALELLRKEAERLRTEADRRPDEARVLRAMNDMLQAANRSTESLPYLERLVEIEPDNGQLRQDLAYALLPTERSADALAAIETALRIDSENRNFLSSKADLLRYAGQYQQSVDLCDQLLAGKADDVFVLGVKGASLRGLDLVEDALVAFDKALELNKTSGILLAYKAGALCDAGQFNPALAVLEEVDEKDRSNGYYWMVRGWALENLGFERTKEALEAYDRSIFYDRDGIHAYRGRGDMRRRLGLQEAAQDYEWLIERTSPPSGLTGADLVALKGWSCYGLGRVEEAEKYLIDALALDKSLISVQFDLAIIVLCRGRGRVAHREYRQGVELCRPKTPARRKGLIAVARRDLNDAVRMNPKLAELSELKLIRELLERALDPSAASESADREPVRASVADVG